MSPEPLNPFVGQDQRVARGIRVTFSESLFFLASNVLEGGHTRGAVGDPSLCDIIDVLRELHRVPGRAKLSSDHKRKKRFFSRLHCK